MIYYNIAVSDESLVQLFLGIPARSFSIFGSPKIRDILWPLKWLAIRSCHFRLNPLSTFVTYYLDVFIVVLID